MFDGETLSNIKFFLSVGEQAPFTGSGHLIDDLPIYEIKKWVKQLSDHYKKQQEQMEKQKQKSKSKK